MPCTIWELSYPMSNKHFHSLIAWSSLQSVLYLPLTWLSHWACQFAKRVIDKLDTIEWKFGMTELHTNILTSSKFAGGSGHGLLYFFGSYSCSISHFFAQDLIWIGRLLVPYSRPLSIHLAIRYLTFYLPDVTNKGCWSLAGSFHFFNLINLTQIPIIK